MNQVVRLIHPLLLRISNQKKQLTANNFKKLKFWPRAWSSASLYTYSTFNLIKEFTLTFGKINVLLNRLLLPEDVAFSELTQENKSKLVLKKNFFLALVKVVRKTSFRAIAIGERLGLILNTRTTGICSRGAG